MSRVLDEFRGLLKWSGLYQAGLPEDRQLAEALIAAGEPGTAEDAWLQTLAEDYAQPLWGGRTSLATVPGVAPAQGGERVADFRQALLSAGYTLAENMDDVTLGVIYVQAVNRVRRRPAREVPPAAETAEVEGQAAGG